MGHFVRQQVAQFIVAERGLEHELFANQQPAAAHGGRVLAAMPAGVDLPADHRGLLDACRGSEAIDEAAQAAQQRRILIEEALAGEGKQAMAVGAFGGGLHDRLRKGMVAAEIEQRLCAGHRRHHRARQNHQHRQQSALHGNPFAKDCSAPKPDQYRNSVRQTARPDRLPPTSSRFHARVGRRMALNRFRRRRKHETPFSSSPDRRLRRRSDGAAAA